MNPISFMSILGGIVNILPGAVNTVGSLFKNKKNTDAKTSALMPALAPDTHNIAAGLELSSKVVAGYGIGGVIVTYALSHEPMNVWVLAIGAAIIAVTTVAKVLEK